MDTAVAVSAYPPTGLERESALERLEQRITELWGHLNAATYRFLMLVADFDREQAYGRHGLVNTAQWLNWQCGIGAVAGREKVRVARALEKLPETSAAFERGEISYSKVRAMTRVATPANEAVLVNVARHGTAAHVEKLVRKYQWCARRDANRDAHKQHLARSVSYFYDGTGDFIVHARLPPEIGAIVRKALDMAGDIVRDQARGGAATSVPSWVPENSYVPAETCSDSHAETSGARRTDALRLVAESFIAQRAEDTGSWPAADRYQVVVHVDQAVLAEPCRADETEPHFCEVEDGPALAIETARRLGCDATLVGVVDDEDGVPLDVGRKTRSIPPAIARALKARDGGCRFPGCDRTRFTEGHHVKHWADGGETKLENLVTLCSFHHRLVHEGGFGLKVTDDRAFVFTRPDGRRVGENGRWTVSQATAEKCFRGNIDAGLKIDSRTAQCRWGGESMDYSMAIEGMQWLDERSPATG